MVAARALSPAPSRNCSASRAIFWLSTLRAGHVDGFRRDRHAQVQRHRGAGGQAEHQCIGQQELGVQGLQPEPRRIRSNTLATLSFIGFPHWTTETDNHPIGPSRLGLNRHFADSIPERLPLQGVAPADKA